jgi:SIR2-like domain
MNADGDGMPDWTEEDWEELILFIEEGQCTPFLGAGASASVLPLGSELALEWAKEHDYPFLDRENLVRVSQFLAAQHNSRFVKLKLRQRLSGTKPSFADANEIHRVVADLRLPVYITTNYDDFLSQAIALRGGRPHQVVCNWYLNRKRRTEIPLELGFEPSPDEPVVYHLHGRLQDWESMVLTEDDYLDFLIYVHALPSRIERAFTDSSLLFLGYSLEDMNFKVLFRKLASYQLNEGAQHVAVQLKPAGLDPTKREIQRALKQAEYLQQHMRSMSIKVFWGSCEDFARGLREHWTSHGHS